LADALDGAPAIECAVGPATRRLGGQWLGAPVNGLDDLAAAVFEATAEIVPVTHPQPFLADIVLARGRVPHDLAGAPVGAAWTADAVFLVADRSSPRDVRFDHLAEFDWVGDGSFSRRSATAQPVDASVARRLPGAGTLPPQRLRQAVF
jgi:hypothetical protein